MTSLSITFYHPIDFFSISTLATFALTPELPVSQFLFLPNFSQQVETIFPDIFLILKVFG